jgi:hypothetical protein
VRNERELESTQKMQSSGKTYEHSGNTTEWDDILIKKGIITREDALIAKGLNPADVRLTTKKLVRYRS